MNSRSRASFHITLLVMGIHLFFLFLFSSPLPQPPPPAKKIVVVTKNLSPLPSFSTHTAEKVQTTQGTKTIPVAVTTPKPKQILKKLDQKSRKISPLPKKNTASPRKTKLPKKASPPTSSVVIVPSPPTITALLTEESGLSSFETLSLFFEKNLTLPEKGSVKVTITIQANGKIGKVDLVRAESEKNLHYLQAVLPLLTLPASAREGECVITFCNGVDDEKDS